jgi:hypothetical protein
MGIDVLVFISGCLTSYHATQKLAAHGKLDYMKMYVTRYIKYVSNIAFDFISLYDVYCIF